MIFILFLAGLLLILLFRLLKIVGFVLIFRPTFFLLLICQGSVLHLDRHLSVRIAYEVLLRATLYIGLLPHGKCPFNTHTVLSQRFSPNRACFIFAIIVFLARGPVGRKLHDTLVDLEHKNFRVDSMKDAEVVERYRHVLQVVHI